MTSRPSSSSLMTPSIPLSPDLPYRAAGILQRTAAAHGDEQLDHQTLEERGRRVLHSTNNFYLDPREASDIRIPDALRGKLVLIPQRGPHPGASPAMPCSRSGRPNSWYSGKPRSSRKSSDPVGIATEDITPPRRDPVEAPLRGLHQPSRLEADLRPCDSIAEQRSPATREKALDAPRVTSRSAPTRHPTSHGCFAPLLHPRGRGVAAA